MVDESPWSRPSSRRQFLARGCCTVGALATAGLIGAAPAAADPAPAPSATQLAVVGGLGSAILIASGRTGPVGAFGLLGPADVAAGFASVAPDVGAWILTVLDAIEAAPASGSFGRLSDAQRQTFLRGALAELRVSPPADARFRGVLASDLASYVTQARTGALVGGAPARVASLLAGDAPDPPRRPLAALAAPPPPPPPAQALAASVLAGLRLVALPLPVAPVSAAPAAGSRNDLLTSLATILPRNAQGAVDDAVGALVAQLVRQAGAADASDPQVVPSRLLPIATAAWLS